MVSFKKELSKRAKTFEHTSPKWFPNISNILIYIVSGSTTFFSALLAGSDKWGEVTLFYVLLAYSVALGSMGIPSYVSRSYFVLSVSTMKYLRLVSVVITSMIAMILSFITFSLHHRKMQEIDFIEFTLLLGMTAIFVTLYEIQIAFFSASIYFNFVSLIRVLNVSLPGLVICILAFYEISALFMLLTILFSYIMFVLTLTLIKIEMHSLQNDTNLTQIKREDPDIEFNIFSKSLKQSWKLNNTIILSLFALKIDLFFVFLRGGPQSLATYSLAILCSDVAVLFANGYYLNNFLSGNVSSNFSPTIFRQFKMSISVGIPLSFLLLVITYSLQQTHLFDDFPAITETFLALIIGAIFLIYLKIVFPIFLRENRVRVLNYGLSLIVVIKIGIFLLADKPFSIVEAGLVTSLSYLIGVSYIFLSTKIEHHNS